MFTINLLNNGNSQRPSTGKQSDNSDGFVWQVSRDPYVALLYDFDIRRAELKPAHKTYLKKIGSEISDLSAKDWHISLEGRASRTGSDGSNLSLSRDRAIAVHEFLSGNSILITKDWVGEEAAKDEGDPDKKENLFFRAVLLRMWSSDKPKPPAPVLPKNLAALPTGSIHKHFKIRLVYGSSASYSTPVVKSVSVGKDFIYFRIWDVKKKMAADFTYSAITSGFGTGLDIFGFSGSVYGGGNWADFETPAGWTLEGFEGGASLTTYGIDTGFGGPSLGHTSFTFEHISGSRWWPKIREQNIPDLDTGESFGLSSVGATTSISGIFSMKGKPYPYEGP